MKKLALLGLVGVVLAGCGNSGSQQQGFNSNGQVNSIYTYGIDNSTTNLQFIEQALGTVGFQDGRNKFAIDVRTLQENNIPVEATSQIYSSAKVTKAPVGYGVQVAIKTPQNITLVTPFQYQSAVIDLGITDVQVDIASAHVATGEGALAGVIYSAKQMGIQISPTRAHLAQTGLDTLAQVAKENPTVNQEQLATAVNDVKSELLNINNSNLSGAQIHQVVTNSITNNNVNITDNSVNQLTQYFQEYNATPEVMQDPAIRDNVKKIKEIGAQGYAELQKGFTEFTNYLNSEQGKQEVGGFFEGLGNFFEGVGQFLAELGKSIGSLFGGN